MTTVPYSKRKTSGVCTLVSKSSVSGAGVCGDSRELKLLLMWFGGELSPVSSEVSPASVCKSMSSSRVCCRFASTSTALSEKRRSRSDRNCSMSSGVSMTADSASVATDAFLELR